MPGRGAHRPALAEMLGAEEGEADCGEGLAGRKWEMEGLRPALPGPLGPVLRSPCRWRGALEYDEEGLRSGRMEKAEPWEWEEGVVWNRAFVRSDRVQEGLMDAWVLAKGPEEWRGSPLR